MYFILLLLTFIYISYSLDISINNQKHQFSLRDDVLKNGLTLNDYKSMSFIQDYALTINRQGPRFTSSGEPAPRYPTYPFDTATISNSNDKNFMYFVGAANVFILPIVFIPFCLIFLISFWSCRFCCDCSCCGGIVRTVKYTRNQVLCSRALLISITIILGSLGFIGYLSNIGFQYNITETKTAADTVALNFQTNVSILTLLYI